MTKLSNHYSTSEVEWGEQGDVVHEADGSSISLLIEDIPLVKMRDKRNKKQLEALK
jgi:hypothetical protein